MATIALSDPLHRCLEAAANWRTSFHTACRCLRQLICGIYGHDFLIHREPRRMCLECTHCGHQTPGWLLTAVPHHSRRL